MNSSVAKIKAISVDELLMGTSLGSKQNNQQNQIVEMPLDQLRTFKNHPFKVKEDEKMAEMADSISKMGILVPGIVRPLSKGGYEIVAGHCRRRGAQLAGLTTMPVIIKELSDAEATVIMVDSNIQREDLTYREKAFAYRMKYDALKELGTEEKAESIRRDQILAKQSGESRNTIHRYIRLTYLNAQLLDMVDNKKLGFIAASDLSYLSEEEQEDVLEFILENGVTVSGEQALQLKECSKAGEWSKSILELVLMGRKEVSSAGKLVIKEQQLKEFFPKEYSVEQMTKVIMQLLEEWKQRQR